MQGGQITEVISGDEVLNEANTSIGGNSLMFEGYLDLQNPYVFDAEGRGYAELLPNYSEEFGDLMPVYSEEEKKEIYATLDVFRLVYLLANSDYVELEKKFDSMFSQDKEETIKNIRKMDLQDYARFYSYGSGKTEFEQLKNELEYFVETRPDIFLDENFNFYKGNIARALRDALYTNASHIDMIFSNTNDVTHFVLRKNYSLLDAKGLDYLKNIQSVFQDAKSFAEIVGEAFNASGQAENFYDNIIAQASKYYDKGFSNYVVDILTSKQGKINLAKKLFNGYIYTTLSKSKKGEALNPKDIVDFSEIRETINNGISRWRADFLVDITPEEIRSIGGYDGVVFKNIIDYGGLNPEIERKPSNVYVAFGSNQFKLLENNTPTDSDYMKLSKRKEYTNDELSKLNFKENTRPNDDFAQAQYRYIKGKVKDLIDTIDTEEDYDIVATPSTRYNDSLTVKLNRNGKTIKSFRIQNKDWWNAKEKGIVKKIRLSDYKQVGGLLSAVKSTIAKEFDAGVKLTKEEQQKRALKGKDKIIKGIKETGRETIKGYIKENERLLKVGRNEELRLKEKAERESKKAEGKISRLSRAYLQKKFSEEFERKAHTANIHYGREYKNLYIGLRETKMDQKEAFALVNAIYNESQRVNNAIKSSLNILNELRKRKIYNKLPSELKEKIDSYNEFWSKSGKMADLTLAKRILNDATIRELIGKVALTNSVRNQLLDNNKESVSLKDYLTSIEMAEQFEAGLEQLRNEVKEFQTKDFEEERLQELQEDVDLIKDDIEYELGKKDSVPLKNLVKKFGNRTMLNSLMTFKTETQALMGGNINTPLMILENNLQKGEVRKKRAITNVYGLLNDFLTSSSGINKVLGIEKWKKTLEKSLSNSSDWVDTNITATTKRGREVELRLPKSMIMSLAMHLMNDQNMSHISGAVTRVVTDNNGNTIPTFREGEGIRIPNENLYKLGKSREAYDRGITVKLSYSQVQELVSTLTEEEQQFVEAVKRVFDYTTKLINEVSNNIMGYDLATVENYFPLHTWINQSKQTTDNGRLLNKHSIVDAYTYLTSAGWLQDRVTSFAPIYLENIAEVLDRTVNNVANYYGYAEALRDNNLILRSEFDEPIEFGDGLEEGTLREAIGQLSSSYLENYERLTRFIVGAETQRDSKLRSLMAMNTLTFNMGTWLTQPMSFFNTIKYYSGKDFLSGINPINNNLRLNKLIRQYYNDLGIDTSDTNDYQLARAFVSMATPNLDYRAIGYKTPDIRQLYNKNIEDKIGAHGIEAFDNIAITAIARMMAWTLSQDSSLEFGSEEYFERLGARLTQVLVETQPEFSHINRANIFRSHNGIARMLSLFGTPANQMFNNFAQSWLEFRYQVREGNKKAIGKAFNNLSKSISGVLVSSIAVGLIRALRDQVRADDDETELQDRWISHSIIALLGPTLVLDDVAQFVMAEAKYGGINSYDFNSPETTLLNGITNFAKKTEQLFKDEVSPTKKTVDLIKAVGTITPIDTKGLIRDITTLMRVISPDTYKAYQLQNDSTVYKKWKENSDTDMAQFYKAYTNTRNSVLESKYGYHKADKEKGIESNLKESRRKALKDALGNDAEVNKYMKILFDYKD